MFKKTVISILLVLLTLALPSGASAAEGAIVFSETTRSPAGGLFASRHRHVTQLTTDSADDEPSFSTDGRLVAFVRKGDIWVMRADGSNPRQLTSGDDVDSRPLIAPNGRYVLFERRAFRKRGRDLYTIALRGQMATPLVATPAKEHEAAFSPDGRQVVYVRRAGSGRDDIWSVRPSGTGARNLTRTSGVGESGPRYLGPRIVFSRSGKRRTADSYAAIYSMNRRGERVRRLVSRARMVYLEDANAPTRTILFTRGRGLWAKRVGGPDRKIASFPKRGSITGAISPDGRRIAAFHWEPWGESLSVLDAATGHFFYDVAVTLNLEGSENNSTLGRVIAWQPTPHRR
jgi:dipeptidyl aminopeptidase/acylaminoacyl peptidase